MAGAPLRLGILGAARIAPMALVRPARRIAGAEVTAIAARDPDRAARFAKRHGIPVVHSDYAALLADPDLDAVYNPLPNSLHAEWTIRALEAGKHVLCEKPLAASAAEAERMALAAETTGRVLAEAFHWRHHPLANRMREVVRGELGEVRHLEASVCIPMLLPGNIRYRFDLAGGAAMDVGCYAVNIVRWLAEAEPVVVAARMKLSSPKVDRWFTAELRFGDGRTGRVTGSLASSTLLRISAYALGASGEMHVTNPVMPHWYHSLVVRGARATRRERLSGESTYRGQLRAFAEQVRGGERMSSGARDGVSNMRVIDDIYEAAGLPKRGG